MAGVTEEVEGLDEEFLFHLDRGASLLGRAEVASARESLERALGLRPRDPQVLGLLGQAFYRQGLFEQAAVAWRRLVDDNPVEPGARVNLGLACLKARRYHDAIRQLEIALDLNPEHRKAMGYLGLALLESGSVAPARDWFRKGGSDQMVARCDELLAQAGEAAAVPAAHPPEQVQALAPLLTSALEAEGEAGEPPVEAPAEPPAEAAVEQTVEPSGEGPADLSGAAGAGPAPADEAADLAAAPASLPAHLSADLSSAPTLAAFAASRVVAAGPEPFTISAGSLAVAVRGEILCRLTGLAAWRGEVVFSGEVKRFRGRATDKPFGEGADRMHRLAGEGLVVLRPARHRFAVLDLGGESGYFRETVVFAFEEQVAYENGRLASSAGDLDLVHLRGRGRVVLRTWGEPVAVDVSPGAPVRVPVASLVGWTGGLGPRLAPMAGAVAGAAGVDAGGGAVELTGEGRVLVDPAGEGA